MVLELGDALLIAGELGVDRRLLRRELFQRCSLLLGGLGEALSLPRQLLALHGDLGREVAVLLGDRRGELQAVGSVGDRVGGEQRDGLRAATTDEEAGGSIVQPHLDGGEGILELGDPVARVGGGILRFRQRCLGIKPELIDPVEVGADRVELLPGGVEVGLGIGLRGDGDEGHGEQRRCQEHAEEGAGADRHLRSWWNDVPPRLPARPGSDVLALHGRDQDVGHLRAGELLRRTLAVAQHLAHLRATEGDARLLAVGAGLR